jgi:AcrR family transcriptional regulator
VAPTDRRELERARRKQEILDAARAVFAQDGYNRATVAAVARRAELGKGTIYLYFETKETILAELTLQALGELGTQLQIAVDRCSPLHPDRRLRAMADAYLAFAQHAPDYFRLLNAFDHGGFQDGISETLTEHILVASNRTLDLVAQAVADGMALGIFAHDDARQAAGVLWAALNGALALAAHPIRRTLVSADPADLYRATFELCLKGLEGCSIPPREA